MRIVATHKAQQNAAALDPWTAVHLSAGLALGLMGIPLRWSLAASVVYEIVEQFVERQEWGRDFFNTPNPESPVNATVDIVVLAFGHHLGTLWNATRPRSRRRT